MTGVNTLISPARDHDLVSVQCLRGLAATMVVGFHCFPQLERMGYDGNQHISLSAGVDVFFIISGFIMLVSARRSPSRGADAFLLNRAIRIVPIYWLLTSVMVAFVLTAPQLLSSSRFDLMHVIKSYLMIPAQHPVIKEMYWPILIPGWTLNYEMFFYAIFALGLAFIKDRGRNLSLFIGTIITAIVLIPLVVPVNGIAAFYTDSIMLEFVFGIVAAELYLSGRRIPLPVGAVAIVVGAGLLLLSDYVRFPDIKGLAHGLPALLIFVGAVFAPWRQTGAFVRGMRLLGDGSYSIYLTHMITMAAIGQAWRKVLGGSVAMPGNAIAFIVVAVTICTAGGMIFYKVVEQPLTNWLKAVLRGKPPPPLAASA